MTRRELRWVCLGGVLAALAMASAARPLAIARPAETTPTVVVEPTLAPAPVFLPRLLKRFDPRLPGPVESRFEGHVVKLTRAGREACVPATHVLQTKPEGFPGAEGLAALYSPHPGADYNLDFYVGEYVEVFGFAGLAPTTCRTLTWQLLSVEAIRRIVLPPGAVR